MAAGPAAAEPSVAPAVLCTNCGHTLAQAGQALPNYCPHCGQESRVGAPRLSEFLQQFGGAYLSTEGALWRTLKLLLFRPGELTLQYLRGRRRHFVLPLRLYLTISLLVLLVLRSVAHVNMDVQPDSPKDLTPTMDMRVWGGQAGLRNGQFYCDPEVPAWLCQRLKQRLDVAPTAVMQAVKAFGDRFVANLGAAMFVLLPGFALALQLGFWRWRPDRPGRTPFGRNLHYTEHLVVALHLHAFWFLMIGLMLTAWPPALVAGMLATPVYGLWSLKRIYGGRWWGLLLRSTVVNMLHLTTLSLALAGVAFWSLVF